MTLEYCVIMLTMFLIIKNSIEIIFDLLHSKVVLEKNDNMSMISKSEFIVLFLIDICELFIIYFIYILFPIAIFRILYSISGFNFAFRWFAFLYPAKLFKNGNLNKLKLVMLSSKISFLKTIFCVIVFLIFYML